MKQILNLTGLRNLHNNFYLWDARNNIRFEHSCQNEGSRLTPVIYKAANFNLIQMIKIMEDQNCTTNKLKQIARIFACNIRFSVRLSLKSGFPFSAVLNLSLFISFFTYYLYLYLTLSMKGKIEVAKVKNQRIFETTQTIGRYCF